jgi:hypothetical protein
MSPRMQQDIEMGHLDGEAGKDPPEAESVHSLTRGLSWTKSWKMRVRLGNLSIQS